MMYNAAAPLQNCQLDFEDFSSDTEKLSAILKRCKVSSARHKLSYEYYRARKLALLYLTETDEPDWGEHGIINRRLKQPSPYVWTGDDAAWDALFDEASAFPPMIRADGDRR